VLTGSYNLWLVLASLLVAVLASYTALDMAGRVAANRGRTAHWWLAGGSVAMGVGIWSMHFLGMLAFSLPIPMGYDPAITILSLLIAIPPRHSRCGWSARTISRGCASVWARC
jgi:NO-binding membrane sensor protein with MHYT domain